MSRTVHEVMNHEVFAVLPQENVGDATKYLVSLGISGCPVTGADGRPMGHVSLRDLVEASPQEPVSDHMTSPAVVISTSDTICDAGRKLAAQSLHRLIVTDKNGRTVGVISAVDVVRGLLGLPAKHPVAFPHLDARGHVNWTDELALDLRAVDQMPEGGGVLTLTHGAPGDTDRIVWVEAADHLGKRFIDMLSEPQTPPLSTWLETANVRVRTASIPDADQRTRLVSRLRPRIPVSMDTTPRGRTL